MKHLFLAAAIVSLAACTTSSPDVVRRYDSQRMSQVYDATVLSVRPVTVEGSQSGLGAGAGAVAGGVAGSSIGGHRDSIVAGVLGAVVGGVIGNAVERGTTRENAVEIMVQLRNGERRSVVQAVGAETYAVGEPVVLVTTGGRTRVARAPSGYAPAPGAYPSPAPSGYPAPAGYPNAPVQPVYPSSGPVPPRS
ncbi:MAG: glycine zipper 2TM domain-containing protein [Caldimonas sp.]